MGPRPSSDPVWPGTQLRRTRRQNENAQTSARIAAGQRTAQEMLAINPRANGPGILHGPILQDVPSWAHEFARNRHNGTTNAAPAGAASVNSKNAARRNTRFDNQPTVNTILPYNDLPDDCNYSSEDEDDQQAAGDLQAPKNTPLGNDHCAVTTGLTRITLHDPEPHGNLPLGLKLQDRHSPQPKTVSLDPRRPGYATVIWPSPSPLRASLVNPARSSPLPAIRC